MTNEQRLKYLKNKGLRCPYCETPDITAREMNADGDVICVEVSCDDCGKEWVDIYKFADVMEA
jgi:C4-type Zn-finger protein